MLIHTQLHSFLSDKLGLSCSLDQDFKNPFLQGVHQESLLNVKGHVTRPSFLGMNLDRRDKSNEPIDESINESINE